MAKAAGTGSEEEVEICRRKLGKWRCKNAIAHNEVRYCQKHYEEMKKLPPDEERCCQTGGNGIYRSRCKNFRMRRSHGGAAADADDSFPKTKLCENHYNLRAKYSKNLKEKKRSGDGEGAGAVSGPIEETRTCVDTDIDGGNVGTKTKNKKNLPPDGKRCGMTNGGGWRCKNFRMGHGAAVDDTVPKTRYCEKHYNLNAKNSENRKKKVPEEDDEQRCGLTGGGGWRCKNFRMGHGAASDDDNVPKSKYCEKHYCYFAEAYKKKIRADGDQGAGSRTATSPVDTIIESGSANIGTKRDNVEGTQGSGELDFLTGNPSLITSSKEMEEMKLPPDEQRCSQTNGRGWRCKYFRMGHGSAADHDNVPKSRYCEKHYNCNAKYNAMYYRNHRKKRTGDREATVSSATGPIECRGLTRRRRKVTEEDNLSLDLTGDMPPATSDDTSVTIVEGGTSNIRRKRKNVQRGEDVRFVDDILRESEDSDGYVDSENSLGDLMDMLGMENWNRNSEKMKWKSEADILSTFEEEPVLLYL